MADSVGTSGKGKRTRTTLTAGDKKRICVIASQTQDPTLDKVQGLAAAEGIVAGRSTVGEIMKNSAKWLTVDDACSIAKDRKAKFPELETALVTWLNDKTSHNIDVSGDMMIEKTKEFGASLNIPATFKYTRGWLNRFKDRHGIKQYIKHGEAASVSDFNANQARRVIWEQIKEYDPSDRYNFDETALFYKLGPDKTLATGPVAGQKRQKERITVALCVNATGSDMRVPIVIGRSKNPLCFRTPTRFDHSKFVVYHHSKNAWMVSDIFESFLRNLDRDMRIQKRKIVLLIDNASSHTAIELANVKIVKLPPNMTSKVQPLDAGIIANFKVHYRKLLVRQWLAELELTGRYKLPTIRTCIELLRFAWNLVGPQTVSNCWQKAGLPADPETFDPDIEIVDHDEDETPLPELEHLVNNLPIEHKLTAQEWVGIDTNESTGEHLTFDQIVAIAAPQVEEVELSSGSDDEGEGEEERIIVTRPMALRSLTELQTYVSEHMDLFTTQDLFSLRKLQNCFTDARLKNLTQTSMKDYFPKE